MQPQAFSDLSQAVGVALGAAGTYLLLPYRHGGAKPKRVHIAGGILTAIALLLLATFWKPPGPFLTSVFFYAFSFAAIAGGILTITSRNPIYSALWFASVVLSSSGLFLLAGAQFLAAGTVIVYAGAIIVTFLFVIMLAQMEGRAIYDRASRSPFRATMTSFLLFWAVMYSLVSITPGARVFNAPPGLLPNTAAIAGTSPSVDAVVARAVRPTAKFVDEKGVTKPHVASLGETLFTDHLITAELAGTLLFVALIAALAIATPKAPIRPGDRSPA